MTAPLIMLVDDEATFVATMAKRLEEREIETILAYNGEECLEALEKHQNVDVIVLDVKMPGMDGIETLRKIKMAFPLIEVILLTGHATIDYGVEGMKLGAFDFLMKPCDMDEFVGKLREATLKKREHEDKIKEAQRRELLMKLEK